MSTLTSQFFSGNDFCHTSIVNTLDLPQLISILDGAELIFYQAQEEDPEGRNNEKGIWRYQGSENSWTRVGEMIFARDDFVALPVDNLECK